MHGHGRAAFAALIAIVALGVAPAAAKERKTPPPLRVSNHGVAFKAEMGAFEWCYSQGDQFVCAEGYGAGPPRSERALPAVAGDKVVLRPHAKAKSIEVSTADGESYRNAKPVKGSKRRVWKLKIRKGLEGRKDLVAWVKYARGGDAEFGFGITKEESQGQPARR
jgi:hypothetical protein